jgi:hypothetical protein
MCVRTVTSGFAKLKASLVSAVRRVVNPSQEVPTMARKSAEKPNKSTGGVLADHPSPQQEQIAKMVNKLLGGDAMTGRHVQYTFAVWRRVTGKAEGPIKTAASVKAAKQAKIVQRKADLDERMAQLQAEMDELGV